MRSGPDKILLPLGSTANCLTADKWGKYTRDLPMTRAVSVMDRVCSHPHRIIYYTSGEAHGSISRDSNCPILLSIVN